MEMKKRAVKGRLRVMAWVEMSGWNVVFEERHERRASMVAVGRESGDIIWVFSIWVVDICLKFKFVNNTYYFVIMFIYL